MAHKHSRRRQRSRSRNHDSVSFGLYQSQSPILQTSYDAGSFSTGTPMEFAWTNMTTLNKQGNLTQVNSNTRTFLPSYASSSGRPRKACKVGSKTTKPILMGKSELEEEQIKLFGGEPGDDPTLCFRMLEAFGRMEWIDG
jgi:hypothetical protein